MTSGRVVPGLAALLTAVVLGLLFFVGPTSVPAARADTPSPPPAAPPADEPVGGGGRTLTWLALAGAGSVAIVAGGIVVAVGQRRRPEVSAAEPVLDAAGAPAAGAPAELAVEFIAEPAVATTAEAPAEPGLDLILGTSPSPAEGEPVGAWDDESEVEGESEVEVVPRRGILASTAVTAPAAVADLGHADEGPESDNAGDPPRGRRASDLDAFHLDDPLTLDTGFRPRRAMQPIPDSSVTVAPTVDDSSWSQWYESSEPPVRRGRRALPPEPDDRSGDDEVPTPRRAQLH